jgi:hypothetical protein
MQVHKYVTYDANKWTLNTIFCFYTSKNMQLARFDAASSWFLDAVWYIYFPLHAQPHWRAFHIFG